MCVRACVRLYKMHNACIHVCVRTHVCACARSYMYVHACVRACVNARVARVHVFACVGRVDVSACVAHVCVSVYTHPFHVFGLLCVSSVLG